MFEKLKKNIRHLFFPYNNFTIEILTILNSSSTRLTMADIYRKCFGDPAIARIKLTLDRLEAHGYILADQQLLSNPPKTVYTITSSGTQILEEKNFS